MHFAFKASNHMVNDAATSFFVKVEMSRVTCMKLPCHASVMRSDGEQAVKNAQVKQKHARYS